MAKRSSLTPIGELLPAIVKPEMTPLTPIEQRLVDGAAANIEDPETPRQILYQHTVLCQTCLPYRDPGDEVRVWERLNSNVHLKVLAGPDAEPVLFYPPTVFA